MKTLTTTWTVQTLDVTNQTPRVSLPSVLTATISCALDATPTTRISALSGAIKWWVWATFHSRKTTKPTKAYGNFKWTDFIYDLCEMSRITLVIEVSNESSWTQVSTHRSSKQQLSSLRFRAQSTRVRSRTCSSCSSSSIIWRISCVLRTSNNRSSSRWWWVHSSSSSVSCKSRLRSRSPTTSIRRCWRSARTIWSMSWIRSFSMPCWTIRRTTISSWNSKVRLVLSFRPKEISVRLLFVWIMPDFENFENCHFHIFFKGKEVWKVRT